MGRALWSSSGDTRPRTMNFFIAALLVLRFSPGNAELEDDEEEITRFLFDYATRYSNDLVEDYYYDNSTAIPTMYTYEMDSFETNTIWDLWLGFPPEETTTSIAETPETPGDSRDAPGDSRDAPGDSRDAPGDSRDAEDTQDFQNTAGSPLQCHLPLLLLLSLLGLLL